MKKGKIKIVFMWLTIILCCVVFLVVGVKVKKRRLQIDEEDAFISFSIWDEKFILDTSVPEHNISCKRLTVEFPVEIEIDQAKGWTFSIEGEEINSDKSELKIKEIGALSEDIVLVFECISKNKKIEVNLRTLPTDFPNIETYSDGNAAGVYYFTAHGYLTKMNAEGEIIFYQKETMASGADTDVLDFKQVKNSKGEIRYCFIKRSEKAQLSTYQAYEYIIMNDRYEEIDRITYMSESEKIDSKIMHDNHEFLYLDDGHYVEAAYVNKRVYNIPESVGHYGYGSNVQAVVIQEIKNHEVIWTWDSSDYPQLYELSVADLSSDSDKYANYTDNWSDYAHLNSIEIDPKDGNYICSFRHFDAVIEINHATGEIEWILGGVKDEFGLTDEQKFSHQHAARVTNSGTIILFDNANGKGFSRVIEVKLDEVNKRILSYNAYVVELQQSLWMGSAQRLSDEPDVILIGWGGRGGVTRNTLLLSEVDVQEKKILFEAFCNVDNYRVYKFDN